ncbi:MAG: HAD family hydrolase [Clostridiales bacterium]|nr:HAD family hydrolase [Clostridiales bacterium]
MKNFVFDLYNTLISIRTDEHSADSWHGVVRLFDEKCGIKSNPETLIRLYDECWAKHLDELGKTSKYTYPEGDITVVYKLMAKALGGTLSDSDAVAVAKLAREQSMRQFSVFDGTVELLKELKSKGGKLYILSNAQSAFTEYELGLSGITDMFDGIMLSSDYGCRKPDTAFFGFLFKKYKLSKRNTVMIGDDVTSDGKGAADYGIKYVKADGGAAAHSEEILSLCGADHD